MPVTNFITNLYPTKNLEYLDEPHCRSSIKLTFETTQSHARLCLEEFLQNKGRKY